MSKLFEFFRGSLRLLGLVMLIALAGLAWPEATWADKVEQPIVFDGGEGAIAVVSLYETNPAAQPDGVKALLKTSKSFYKKKVPGFQSFALFSSVDGQRILEFTQWQDQASYEDFQASLAAENGENYTKYYEKYTKDKGKSTLVAPNLLSQSSFRVDQAVAPPGMVPVIEGANALVQVSTLVAEDPKSAEALGEAAIAALANLPSLYPAPRSAVVLKGTSTTALTLITNWGTTNEFRSPDQVPALSLDLISQPDSELGDGPAAPGLTREDRLYQLVKVIAPKSEKYGKD